MSEVNDSVDSDDPTSADILHDYIAALEQQAWFVGAELRHPKNTKARRSSTIRKKQHKKNANNESTKQ